MIKTWRGLVRSLVRRLCYRSTIGLAVLTFCTFLPFVSFGDLVPDNMLFNIWPYLYTRGGSSPALQSPASHETAYSPITASALDSYFFNNRFGVLLNSDYSLAYPNIYPSGTLTNSSMNSTFNLQAVDGSGWYCPVRICPSIQSYASISARLFFYGYIGNGIDTVGTNRNGKISFNVNPSILFSEVLYGTNYLFRQTLLNHLSSINSSVQNIELNVSGLQSSIDEGNSLLQNLNSSSSFLASNSVATVSALSNVASNTAASFSTLSNVASNTLSSASILSNVASNTAASASHLSNVASNTAASASHLSNVASNTAVSASHLSDIAQNSSASAFALADISSNTLASASSLSNVASNTLASASSLSNVSSNTAASASHLSQVSSNTLSSASSLSNVSSNTAASASHLSDIADNSSSMASDLGSIKTDAYYTRGNLQNVVMSLNRYLPYSVAPFLGNGSPDPNNPFFPYDPSNPNDPNHPSNPDSPWNPSNPNSLAGGGGFGAFTTNNVMSPITNSVHQGSAEIQSNATSNARDIMKNDNEHWQDYMDLIQGDGINARITFPLYTRDNEMVNVHDQQLEEFAADFHHSIEQLLDSLGSIEVGLGGLDPVVTNIIDLSSISNLVDSLTNYNHYLLLDDYGVYISNGVYSSSVDSFKDEFPNVYSNLVKYGLSSDGNGNFWSLFGANLLYQSGLIGNLLEDMALVRNFADEHIEGGFTEGVKKIVDSFPSPTQLEDFLSSASNQLSQIESSTNGFFVAFTSLTNATSSVFDPFKGEFDSPPDGLVFFKTGNEQYVTIPVRQQMSVWSTLRLGFSFGLVAVNLLLFPKFILLLVKLFARLYNRFVKFVPEE